MHSMLQQRLTADFDHSTNGSPEPDLAASWRVHMQRLTQLANAESFSLLESSRGLLMGYDQKMPFIELAARGPSVDHDYLEVLVKAAINCMRLIAQKKSSFLVCSCGITGILTALWGDTSRVMSFYVDKKGKQRQLAADSRLCAAFKGLIPALSSYSQSFASSVNQLTQTPAEKAYMELLQELKLQGDMLRKLWALLYRLQQMWSELCVNLANTTTCCRALVKAAPAVTCLAAAAVPQLFKVSLNVNRSSNLHKWLIPTACETARVAQAAGAFYAIISCELQLPHQDAEMQLQQRQDLKQLLLTENMTQTLLLSLAGLAYILQSATQHCHSEKTSAAVPSCSAGLAPSQDQQQQQKTGWCGQHHAIFDSHVVLVHILATGAPPASCQKDADNSAPAADGDGGDGSESAQVRSRSQRLGLRGGLRAVRTLKLVILHRMKAARRVATNVDANSSSNQRQQGTELSQVVAFPDHLITPAVKVLVEIMLLLSPENIGARAEFMELAMLLLHTLTKSATMALTTTSGGQGEAAGCQQSTASATAADACVWPVLPAAVAAGLLHPVVQLLSRAVIHALQRQPKQQQRRDVNDAVMSPTANCLRLLHHYGNLLITVCLSVEPKHIAAALKSDPVIPLVAIEAVIRAQACHLTANSSSQPQQPNARADLLLIMPDITDHPRDQAAVLLLPFVSKVVCALRDLVQNKQLLELLKQQMLSDGDLPTRLFSTAATALKVVQAATACFSEQHDTAVTVTSLAASSINTTAEASSILRNQHTNIAVSAWVLEVKEWLAAVATEDSTAPPPAPPEWRSGPSLKSRAGLSLHVPINVMQLAIGWDNVLKARRCNFLRQSILPMSILLQALGAYAAALFPFHSVSTQYALHDGTSCLFPVECLGGNVPSSMVAAAVSRLLTDVVNRLQLTCVAVDAMSFWSAVVNETAAVEAPGRYSQQQWLDLHLSSRKSFLKLLIIVKCMPEVHNYGCMGAVAACTGATEVNFTVPLNNNPVIGNICVTRLDYAATCEDPAWNQKVSTCFQDMRDYVAAAAASFPMAFCCNNPSCLNLSKLSEYQLVSGKASVCGGCKVARYCSRECQKKHWKQHRVYCNSMQQVQT